MRWADPLPSFGDAQTPLIIATKHHSAQGKLLISGEYAVLDGALALALPTKVGQHLEVFDHYSRQAELYWRSLDHQSQCWFETRLQLPDLSCLQTSDDQATQRLQQLLQSAIRQNPDFAHQLPGRLVQTRLDFPRLWGLGSSSTLVHLLAQWAQVDSYDLLADTFGGSGYDLACAAAQGPILYQRINGQPTSKEIDFSPDFRPHIYFVYLGRKQNSREGIARYRELGSASDSMIQHITNITEAMLAADSLRAFESLIRQHEQLVSGTLALIRAKNLYFDDYWGEVKSLGAWGGDFVLITNNRSREELKSYLQARDFHTLLSYDELILSRPSSTP
ncbi:MAG: GYDIA family GHMP kinase [Bacteroidota bacterium]